MVITGRCHCGNISFSLRWELEPSEIPARACTCAFCTKYGGVWTSCPTGFLAVNVAEPASVRRAPATFDGETEPARLARRMRNWIGKVKFTEGGR